MEGRLIKITNKHKLPKAIVDAIKQTQSEYDNQGSFLSASSALKPPRIYWLEKRYWDQLECDAVDLIWSFLGTASHFAAEKAGIADKNTIAEQRYFTDVLGKRISAQIDNYEIKTETLTDFKITSVWSLMGEPKKDWLYQMNIQKYLMELHGHKVSKIQIVAVGRDWSKSKTLSSSDYPKKQIKRIPIKILPNEEVINFLEGRVSLLVSHENTPDDSLPPCTAEERWAKEDVYAVMKEGRKRALKLFSCPMEADIHAKQNAGYVELRKGEDIRCQSYCQCNKFCNYYKENYGDK